MKNKLENKIKSLKEGDKIEVTLIFHSFNTRGTKIIQMGYFESVTDHNLIMAGRAFKHESKIELDAKRKYRLDSIQDIKYIGTIF